MSLQLNDITVHLKDREREYVYIEGVTEVTWDVSDARNERIVYRCENGDMYAFPIENVLYTKRTPRK